ncbi:MAG: DUF3365 domain-containing protein [Bacteroidales bacterium]|nr:DUF3365 domain-containing protein [Bacteroidales bacterium]
MKSAFYIFLLLTILISGCVQTKEQTKEDTQAIKKQQPAQDQPAAQTTEVTVYPTLSDSLHRELMIEGAILVQKSMFGIKSALTDALKTHGPMYALNFCNMEAIPITDSLARVLNVGIKRVAKKFRNPNNETNEFENKIYKEYIMSFIQRGVPKPRVDIDKNGHPVYYKLISVKQECMLCHGRPNVEIPSDIAAKIKELYPNDKAIDFAVGQPRGMWAITFNNILIQTKTQ